jgi:hypothetical protein
MAMKMGIKIKVYHQAAEELAKIGAAGAERSLAPIFALAIRLSPEWKASFLKKAIVKPPAGASGGPRLSGET